MLLFLADDPAANERDGMAQRVQWIDEQFGDRERVLLRISLKGCLRRKRYVRSPLLAVEELNLFLHFPRLLRLAKQSQFVYVHSCGHALRGLPLYYLRIKVITDLHGVMAEEMRLSGQRWLARIFSLTERVVWRRSAALVFVTRAMRQHFENKHGGAPARSYIIPIMSKCSAKAARARDPRMVIYAGGLQPWQRVEQMLDAVAATQGRFRFLFLTGDAETLRVRLRARSITGVEVDSLPGSVIPEYLQGASLGFILRDDSVVNRVACPTKLVEYLRFGVVPIVEQPVIGDFCELGYKYIPVSAFIAGRVPDAAALEQWREKNRCVALRLEELTMAGLREMREEFCGRQGVKGEWGIETRAR
jgi:hypothetical protein